MRRQAVELRRHDEVVLVQTFDLLSPQRDRGVAPAEGDVGMMALGLGKLARPLGFGRARPWVTAGGGTWWPFSRADLAGCRLPPRRLQRPGGLYRGCPGSSRAGLRVQPRPPRRSRSPPKPTAPGPARPPARAPGPARTAGP